MKEVMFFKLPIHDDLDNAAIDLGYDTVQNLSTVPRVSRILSCEFEQTFSSQKKYRQELDSWT